ncbi:Low-density lipoprotein receptor-related protein 1B [Cricetulus griseus]|uniref:Low-density lipoprotein receptor-related protein 1B n=1 Tax=Cricetulus griseus TaxID=10029 RepID=G3IBA3_CRIGR|nr:Low-density lipoprotein receptor-related protein 1B [Cricetulus griseus]
MNLWGLNNVIAIDFDYREEFIYWIDSSRPNGSRINRMCLNGSDIKTHVCLPGQFKCTKNQKCIPVNLRCNGQDDCGDEEDERDCPENSCSPDYFQCKTTKHCISKLWVCDEDPDCADASDEANCGKQCFPDNGAYLQINSLTMAAYISSTQAQARQNHSTECCREEKYLSKPTGNAKLISVGRRKVHFLEVICTNGKIASSCQLCDGYCYNGGTCKLDPETSVPVCVCSTNWSGTQCERPAPKSSKSELISTKL